MGNTNTNPASKLKLKSPSQRHLPYAIRVIPDIQYSRPQLEHSPYQIPIEYFRRHNITFVSLNRKINRFIVWLTPEDIGNIFIDNSRGNIPWFVSMNALYPQDLQDLQEPLNPLNPPNSYY